MTLLTLVQRARSSLITRLVTFAAAVSLMAVGTHYLTRDIRVASGADPNDHALLAHFIVCSVWASLLWATISVRARAVPRVHPRLRVPLEIALCAGYAWLSVEAMRLVLVQALGPPTLPGNVSIDDFKPMMMVRSATMYTLIVAVLAAVKAELERRRSESATRELRLQQETLRGQLTAARLQTLQAQINPHFLFNAIHAIGGLILEGDKLRAHRALASLSLLLRRSLKQGEQRTSTVEAELELVRQYLELEQLRFGERLQFRLAALEDTLSALVPTLILLPIVENAVTHGLEPQPNGGLIEVKIAREADQLEILVEDNGVGQHGSSKAVRPSTGIGLGNTSERLHVLYGEAATVTLQDRAPCGTTVRLRLPLGFEAAPETNSPELVS